MAMMLSLPTLTPTTFKKALLHLDMLPHTIYPRETCVIRVSRSGHRAFSTTEAHKCHNLRNRRRCFLVCKARKVEEDEKAPTVPPKPPSKRSSSSVSNGIGAEVTESSYAFVDWQRYAAPFAAPWSGKSAALGMVAWAASFVGVGFAFLPLAKYLTGPGGLAEMSQQEKALFILANQVAETAVGVALIRAAAATRTWSDDRFFKLDIRAPFRKPDGWATWALLGVVLSPGVVYSAAMLCESLGLKDDPTARGTADAVSQLLQIDPVTFAALFTTTAVLAPVLEETVFRGFLLPSLAKVMPTPLAVALSSVAFGLVHLSPRDTPQLTALGLLLGFFYVRSRNLLTPMMIHGVWNGTVLCVLYWLQSQGVDLQKALHGG